MKGEEVSLKVKIVTFTKSSKRHWDVSVNMLIFINHLLLNVGGDGLGLVLFLSKMEILCRLIHSVENVPTIFPDVDLDLVLLS